MHGRADGWIGLLLLIFCGVGIFALSNVTFDVWTLFWFGILGYGIRKFGFPLAPMIIGVVLGPIAEVNLNRAYRSNADPLLFLSRPLSLFFVLPALISLAFPFWQERRDRPLARLAEAPRPALRPGRRALRLPGPVRSIGS